MRIQDALEAYEYVSRKSSPCEWIFISRKNNTIHKHYHTSQDKVLQISVKDLFAEDWGETLPYDIQKDFFQVMLEANVPAITTDGLDNQVVISVMDHLYLVKFPTLEVSCFSPSKSQMKARWWEACITESMVEKLKNAVPFYVFDHATKKDK